MKILILLTIFVGIISKPGLVAAPDVLALDSIYSQINTIRKQNGLRTLRVNPQLELTAGDKACDLLRRKYWSHSLPGNIKWTYFLNKRGYKYNTAGENLSRGYGEAEVVDRWMASSTHKAIILGPYTEMGYAKCGQFITLHLGVPR